MNLPPVFDATDATLLASRRQKRSSQPGGPRVGDFIELLDGTVRRIAHVWSDRVQPTYLWRDRGVVEAGSFHLDEQGRGDYSGALDSAIPTAKLVRLTEDRLGQFWIFHHGHARAHNGVNVTAPCRVFRQVI